MGWLSDFVGNPLGTVSNTVSDFVQSPSQSIGNAWNSGGRTAAELAAIYYGGNALMGTMGGTTAAGSGIGVAAPAGYAGAADAALATGSGAVGAGIGSAMGSGITTGGVGSALQIASSINSLTGGGLTSALGLGPKSASASDITSAADPFSPYRAGLAAQYAGALAPGGTTDPTKMPGYSQFQSGVMDPAMEASKRSAAASGQLYSGGEAQALQKTAMTGYSGFMTDYLNRLAQGSGAAVNPATAVGMGTQQGNLNAQGVSQGLGSLATNISGLSSLFGSGLSSLFGNAGAASSPTNQLVTTGDYANIPSYMITGG
ncbi:hypothetical protein UFOVP907_15 [uncultured Caudovirales phage]|uniref:Uncharacterized protein n=1 Tax=uncultured Caudovirales phage TaxID=2100421 RepID=A0A6J5PQD7_9CAUD|nr:hypothetical protein UFOVP907_15 [uncultured Caudovirales phage]